jgi:hypothetical protein
MVKLLPGARVSGPSLISCLPVEDPVIRGRRGVFFFACCVIFYGLLFHLGKSNAKHKSVIRHPAGFFLLKG